jgi:predicted PurR-regulated permease PerM
LEKFLEEEQVEQIINVSNRVENRMGAWLWGELILMTVIGVMSYIGLALLHMRYILPLAIIAGLLEIVPIIGPIISTIPAFFVAVSSSWFLGLSIIALYFLIQQLENHLIVPLVMKKAIGLNPIITLIALTIGGKLGGFLGILLSVPAALLLETLLIEITRGKRL